jgi:cell division septation protein DedD
VSRAASILIALLLVAGWPSDVASQDLGRIEALGADGRTSAARDSLLAWWDVEWSSASRGDRERALWLRGLLTLDPVEASASYRRMVIEYPGGAFTGRALHRLGNLAAAVGDTVAAGQWFGMLARDFSGSSLGGEAEAWLAGDRSAVVGAVPSAPAAPEVAAAPTMPTAPDPDSVPDTRSRQLPEDDPPTVEMPPESPPETPWTVQLGAFQSEATAREIAGEAGAAGFEVRVVLVEDSDLWRVRSGRFTDADGARPLLERMRAAGLVAAIVPGADQEVSGG